MKIASTCTATTLFRHNTQPKCETMTVSRAHVSLSASASTNFHRNSNILSSNNPRIFSQNSRIRQIYNGGFKRIGEKNWPTLSLFYFFEKDSAFLLDDIFIRMIFFLSVSPGAHPVVPPLRLPCDPAHFGALQSGTDGADLGRASRQHRAAATGPVRKLRHTTRPGTWETGKNTSKI